jgi:hypothetical protein
VKGRNPLKRDESRPGPAYNLVDCAIYPPMYKLLIRADFDGKGRNKNKAESNVFNSILLLKYAL